MYKPYRTDGECIPLMDVPAKKDFVHQSYLRSQNGLGILLQILRIRLFLTILLADTTQDPLQEFQLLRFQNQDIKNFLLVHHQMTKRSYPDPYPSCRLLSSIVHPIHLDQNMALF